MIINIKKIAAVFLSIGTLLTIMPSLPASAADSVLDDPGLNDYIAEYTEAEHLVNDLLLFHSIPPLESM